MYIIGLVGNLLMFVVYSQSNMRILSVSIYFRSMAPVAFSHIVFKYFFIIDWEIFVYHSNALFKILHYIALLFIPILVWFEVAASFDRLLTILFSPTVIFHQKRLAQSLIVSFIVVYNMAAYSIFAIRAEFINGHKFDLELTEKMHLLEESLFLFELINDSVVPFVLMLGFSLVTFVGVLKVHRRIKLTKRSNMISSSTHQHRTLIRDIKFGITMIVLNVMFFVSIFMHRLNFTFNTMNPFNFNTQFMAYLVYDTVLNGLYTYYYMIMFYIQFSVNNLVRKETRRLFVRIFATFTQYLNKLFNCRLSSSSRG